MKSFRSYLELFFFILMGLSMVWIPIEITLAVMIFMTAEWGSSSWMWGY